MIKNSSKALVGRLIGSTGYMRPQMYSNDNPIMGVIKKAIWIVKVVVAPSSSL